MLASEGTKKDGKPFRKWRCSFKPNEQSDKQFNMSIFQKQNAQNVWEDIVKMEECKWYTITFTEQAGEYQGKAITYKTIFKIVEGKHDNSIVQQSKPIMPLPQATPVMNWETFAAEYDKQMGDKGNAMHMLGAYVANNYPVGFAEIIPKCKAHFKK